MPPRSRLFTRGAAFAHRQPYFTCTKRPRARTKQRVRKVVVLDLAVVEHLRAGDAVAVVLGVVVSALPQEAAAARAQHGAVCSPRKKGYLNRGRVSEDGLRFGLEGWGGVGRGEGWGG